MDLKKIYEEEIRGKLEAGELKSTKKRRWEERFQWFLFGSILLLALESIFPDRKRPPASKAKSARFVFRKQAVWVSLLGLGLLFSATPTADAESVYGKMKKAEESYETEAYAEALEGFLDAQVERPGDIRLKYNVGSTQYRMRGFEEAEEAFWAAANAGDPELKQKAFYNLGNTAYRQGKLEEAVAHFKQALDLDPEDEDARFNLEFVREEIKRRLNEAQEREKKEQEEKQEGQTCQQPQQGESQQGENQQEESQGDRQEIAQQPKAPQQDSPRQPEEGQEEKDSAEQAGEPHEMSPEEAERWLNTLDEEQKEMARKQVQKALGRRPHIPDKDW